MNYRTRTSLLATTVLGTAALFAGSANAQSSAAGAVSQTPPSAAVQQSAPPPEGPRSVTAAADEGDTIIVTGSRIPQRNLESASPLQVVNAQDVQSSGVVNIQELLLQNPVFGTPGISRTNSNFSTSSAGVATIDLRNLGSNRTLVLVNGHRYVSGVPGDQSVDLNTIPTALIERVDVLTGGQSAVYGSDALAGVVNFVLKQNFEGAEANVQYGLSKESDDRRIQANLTIGTNFADGKGNVVAHFGYSDEGAVFSRDRRRSAIDQSSTGALTGNARELFQITTPFFSSFAPQGRFFRAPGVTAGTFDANGNFINGFSTNGSATRAADGYNRSAVRTIAIPTERYLLSTIARYEILPDVSVRLEGTYAHTTTVTQLEPFPLDSAGTSGIFRAPCRAGVPQVTCGGFFPVEQRLANGTIAVNPFVPAALLSQLTDVTGDGLRDVAFTRRLSDVANRGSTANRDTFRILAGLEGNLFDSRFRWEAYYAYGQTSEAQRSTGQFNVQSFAQALQVIPDPVTGQPICADPAARALGCAPANVFGRNTITPAALRFINAEGSLTTTTRQSLAGANIGGELGDLWNAGAPIGVSLGVEYRKESADTNFDALTQAGLNGGNALANTSGSFSVTEGFGEIRVPILADRPFFHNLTLTGSARVSHYNTIGNTFTWNAGGEWAPVQDIRFRAVWANSVRAPNINELFAGPAQTFPTGLQDPCVGVRATDTGTLATVCRADPGVRANIAANGAFTLNQADVQGVSGFNTSNPNLGPEKSRSFTAGVVINPRSVDFLRGFSLTVDYFNIRINDAITTIGRQFALTQCYNQGNPQFCSLITRRAAAEGANSPGSLNFINVFGLNSGGIKTQGIDVTAAYSQNLESLGVPATLNLRAAYTHLIEGYVIPQPGADRDYFAGEVGAAQDRVEVNAGLDFGRFGFTYRGQYIGPSFLDDQFITGFSDPDSTNPDATLGRYSKYGRVGAKYYSFIQARFNANENFELYGGVDNLFNTQPAPIYSNLPGNITGTETAADVYDAIGRRFYVGARMRF